MKRSDFILKFCLFNCATLIFILLFCIFSFTQSSFINTQTRETLLVVFAIGACILSTVCEINNIFSIIKTTKDGERKTNIIANIISFLINAVAIIFMLQFLITVYLVEF